MSNLSRCLRRVPMRYEMLAMLLTGGLTFRVKLGLPPDAEIVSIFGNDEGKELYAIVQSANYSALSIYETAPPVFERIC
jgi:hypothetical protein